MLFTHNVCTVTLGDLPKIKCIIIIIIIVIAKPLYELLAAPPTT